MATKNSKTLTAGEKKDLESLGWNEANPFNIPENVSPVLKSKITEQYKKEQGLVSPADMPSATETQNQFSRARAAEDGDKDMQAYMEDADKNAQNVDTSGTSRQTDVNKK